MLIHERESTPTSEKQESLQLWSQGTDTRNTQIEKGTGRWWTGGAALAPSTAMLTEEHTGADCMFISLSHLKSERLVENNQLSILKSPNQSLWRLLPFGNLGYYD